MPLSEKILETLTRKIKSSLLSQNDNNRLDIGFRGSLVPMYTQGTNVNDLDRIQMWKKRCLDGTRE